MFSCIVGSRTRETWHRRGRFFVHSHHDPPLASSNPRLRRVLNQTNNYDTELTPPAVKRVLIPARESFAVLFLVAAFISVILPVSVVRVFERIVFIWPVFFVIA